jgi:hypothetical protein
MNGKIKETRIRRKKHLATMNVMTCSGEKHVRRLKRSE